MAMILKIVRSIAPVVAASAALCLFTPASLHAQANTSLVTNRLTQVVDDNARITLKGTVSPLARAANDRGAAPDSMPLERIQVVLKRSAAQESALQQLMHDQHTTGTASYHKWLTPAQFGDKFGPSDQDIATLEAWLESKGFNVEKVNAGKQTLDISGSVAQLRNAFHTQIHKYSIGGEMHYANATDPQIPTALAPVFGGFASLNNFSPHRQSHVLGKATYDPKTNKATPQWTWGTSTGFNFVLAPSDFAIQYDLPPANSGTDGSGQTIAIINDSNINVALVNQFRSLFSLPANPPQVIIDGNDPGVDGINNPDGPNYDSVEAYLDVEWAGAVAPKATVDLVIGADTALESGLLLAIEHAVYGNIAPVMSVSFGFGCEDEMGSFNQVVNSLWEQAAAQGITVMVSAGDNASAGCDDDNSQYYAIGGAAVSGLASTPYNVAVGGTDFYYSDYASGGASVGNYWSETPTQNPATSIIKAPIPEQPWNDSQYGLNIFSIYAESGDTQTSIAGGSGGASSCGNPTLDSNGDVTACAGYSKPAWQVGAGVPSDGVRDLPDVSLFAANGLNASFYPVCAGDADCQPATDDNLIQITGIGGTSASSPAFAGIMALVNQKYGPQGQADFVLYPLAKQFPAAFHDVVNGNNSVPCAYSATSLDNTPDCIAVTDPLTVTDPNLGAAVEGQIGTGMTPGYNAGTGYDLATGLGTVDANVLINDWNKVAFTSSSVRFTPSDTSFTHGTAISVSGSVTGTGGTTPTGSVALMTDSTEPGQQGQGFASLFNGGQSVFPLTNGSFSASNINYLPGGTYNIWGQYSGDGADGSASSPKTQITVNPEASGIYFSIADATTGYGNGPVISSGTTGIPYGTQLILSSQVAPSSQLTAVTNCKVNYTTCPTFTPPTGTVAFADNGSTINTAVLNSEGDAEYNAPWSVGSHSVTSKYSGDNSYNTSSSSAFTFSIAKNAPNINYAYSLQTSSGAIIGGQSSVFTVQIQNSSNLSNESAYGIGYSTPVASPTGTVTVSGFPSGVPTSATLAAGVDASSLAAVGVGTIVIPSNTPAGTYTVNFTYSGDGNYLSESGSASIAIQSVGGTASTTAATMTGSISPTTTVTITGAVTGKSGSAAPGNANGGVVIYAAGYYLTQNPIPVTPGTGDSSTFSATFSSQSLLQGTNPITVQYLGDATYAPSSTTLSPAISNPLSDFSMVPETTIVDVPPGGSATDVVNISSVNGFTGPVNLTCTASSGLICSASNSAPSLTSGGSAAVTLTVDGSNITQDGTYNLLLTGADSTGKFVHTLGIEVIAAATSAQPSLTVVPAPPSSVSVTAGNSVNDVLTVTPKGGLTGAVSFTCSVTGGPSGATSPPTCSAPGLTLASATASTSTLKIATTATTTPGSGYVANITATTGPGGVTATATVDITVSAAAAATFTLTPSPATLTLAAGATTGNTSTITAATTTGFTGSVALTCSVAGPSGANDPATCALSPTSVDVSGTAAGTSTLTISTTATTTSALHNPFNKLFAAGGGIVVAGLFLFGIPARRRNWRSILAVLLFAGIVGLGIGCGSSGSGGGGGTTVPGTTAGTYTVTITGTSGSLTPTTTVTVTVD
jgi:hypothetical protein